MTNEKTIEKRLEDLVRRTAGIYPADKCASYMCKFYLEARREERQRDYLGAIENLRQVQVYLNDYLETCAFTGMLRLSCHASINRNIYGKISDQGSLIQEMIDINLSEIMRLKELNQAAIKNDK